MENISGPSPGPQVCVLASQSKAALFWHLKRGKISQPHPKNPGVKVPWPCSPQTKAFKQPPHLEVNKVYQGNRQQRKPTPTILLHNSVLNSQYKKMTEDQQMFEETSSTEGKSQRIFDLREREILRLIVNICPKKFTKQR